ncbi:hypothetical protein ACFL9T_21975 [Thermodesulfobacteriota bacterium]
MDWSVFTIYVSTTILATFFGASAAFFLERRTKKKEYKQVSLSSANRALFILSRQFSILNQFRNQVLNPLRDDPGAWINIPAILPKTHEDLRYDIGSLQFLFESADPNLLTELLMEEDRFFEAIKTINARSNKHSNELQPKLAALGVKEGTYCTDFELEKTLGIDLVGSMKSLTKSMVEHVDEGIDGLKAIHDKLISTFTELFLDEKIIEIKFPEKEPNKSLGENAGAPPTVASMDIKDYRYVAHLDILGMSKIVEKDADEAWGMLSDLVDVRDKAISYEIEFHETNKRVSVIDEIKMVTFSDTILLFTKGDSPTELRCMIILLAEIFHKAMCRCVPVRAGLAVGKFYFNLDKSMYAGPALIKAYRVGEAAQWLGISLDESVQGKAVSLEMKTDGSRVVVKWAVPMKKGCKDVYVINWPAIFAHDLKVDPPISTAQFYQAFKSTFGDFETLPNAVKSKYENTVSFMNHQLKNHVPA